jgi:hypothetical protein
MNGDARANSFGGRRKSMIRDFYSRNTVCQVKSATSE